MTHERDIITNMAQRGVWLSPSLGGPSSRIAWFEAPRLGIVLALLGNLIALALWVPARTAPKLAWVELVFAALLLVVTLPSLWSRAVVYAKRGVWGPDVLALMVAIAAFAIGVAGLCFERSTIALTPNFLLRFGPRADGVSAIAFESAGAIAGFVFLANQLQQAAVRKAFAAIERAIRIRYARVRRILPRGGGEIFVPCALLCPGDRLRFGPGEVVLMDMRLEVPAQVATSSGRVEERLPGQLVFRGERIASGLATGCVEHMPRIDASGAADAEVAREARRIEEAALRREGDPFETTAALSLSLATMWFAVFAVIVHAAVARHAPHPGLVLAAVAVVAGASPAAFLLGLPLARIVAITRARAAGIVVKNVAALEALATIDFAFFDLTGGVSHDAPQVFRALWHRTVACRVLSAEGSDMALALVQRFGVAVTSNANVDEKARLIAATRAAGGRVIHVGRTNTAQMIPVDVSIAIAPNELPELVPAPIMLRDFSISPLVWLIDTARALRRKTRLLLAMTLAYDAIIVPICVAGFMTPLGAAFVNFVFTLVTCVLASRVGPEPRRWVAQDKRALV